MAIRGIRQAIPPKTLLVNLASGAAQPTAEPIASLAPYLASALATPQSSPEFLSMTDFVIYNSAPVLPGASLTCALPSATAFIGGIAVNFAALNVTLAANRLRKYYVNAKGTVTFDDAPVTGYSSMTRRQPGPGIVYIYQISSDASKISSILQTSNSFPVVKHDQMVIGSVDHFIELFYLFDNTTPFIPGMTVSYGQLILNSAGNVYMVTTPGLCGATQPTSTAVGYINDSGGVVIYTYYSKESYLGAFRYGQNNGIEWYFDAIGLAEIVNMKSASGNAFGTVIGTTMASLIKKHLLVAFKHMVKPWYSGGTYLRGMKITVDGWIWECTVAGAVDAANTAFLAGSHVIGQTITTTAGSQWAIIYQYFGAAQLFWLNVDNTWNLYRYPDSHDSYTSTFFSLIARYIEYTGDASFLYAASPQPGYATYKALLDDLIYFNLDTQLVNFLSNSFQGQIAPWDGSVFNTQYFEDNCETVKGYRDASYVYSMLGDPTRSANALVSMDYVAISGLRPMYNTTYNLVAWYLGNDVSTWANRTDLQFYPYIQAQFYAEKCDLEGVADMFTEDQFFAMRQATWNLYSNWITDRGKDSFPNNFLGLIAARKWGNATLAQSFLDQSERYHIASGNLIISEYACYLALRDILVPPVKIMQVTQAGIITKDALNNVVVSGKNCSVITASENLAAGALVNVWNNGGVSSVRNATAATAGYECDGFVLQAVTAPASCVVYFSGSNTAVAGLAAGLPHFLSNSPGQLTTTAPFGPGNVVQEIGKATSSNSLEIGIIELGVILT